MTNSIKNSLKRTSKVIFSPHFDDACLSAFNQIDDQTLIVTVFSGKPKKIQSTKWDRFCGFQDSNEAVEKRRQENIHAAKFSNFQMLDLGFVDWQYNERPTEEKILKSFKEIIQMYRSCNIYIPISYRGFLEHPDHILVTSTMLNCLDIIKERVFFYADLPYQVKGNFVWDNVKNPEKKFNTCKKYGSQLDNLFLEFPIFTYDTLMKEAVLTYKEFRLPH